MNSINQADSVQYFILIFFTNKFIISGGISKTLPLRRRTGGTNVMETFPTDASNDNNLPQVWSLFTVEKILRTKIHDHIGVILFPA